MEQEPNEVPMAAPNPPLFTLDLGANGGVFEPTTVDELKRWVAEEQSFWSWAQQRNFGAHQAGINQAVTSLNSAANAAQQAAQLVAAGDETRWREQVVQAQSHIRAAFITYRLPHSTTPPAKRAAVLKAVPAVAIAYLAPFTWITNNNQSFDARDPESWSGFIAGLIDSYGLVTDIEPKIAAEREALEGLRVRADKLLADKTEEVNQIHRDIAQVLERVRELCRHDCEGPSVCRAPFLVSAQQDKLAGPDGSGQPRFPGSSRSPIAVE